MKGEVKAKDRPLNSLLNEHLEFNQTTKIQEENEEELKEKVEEIIRQRILDNAFDDLKEQ